MTDEMAAGRRLGSFAGRLFRVAYHRAAEGLVVAHSRALAGRLVRVPEQKPTGAGPRAPGA